MTTWTVVTRTVPQLHLTILLIFLSLCLNKEVLATSASDTFNATLTCSMVKNGTFLKDPGACSKWIQCIDDKPMSGACGKDLFYNRNTNECVDPDSVTCYSTDACAVTITDGFVADPNSCNGYYYCTDGTGSLGSCSPGMNFNPGTLDCIRNFTCPEKPDPTSWCNIIPDGNFFADPQSCQKYHLCWNGVLKNGTCPDGYYFNSFTSVCDYQNNVKCDIPELHPSLPGDGICSKAGEFLSDNKTCAGYYYCKEESDGKFLLIWSHCLNGRFFNPINGGECVDRRQIECKFDRCEGMGETNIQLANAPDDGCLGYLVCQNGLTIGRGVCPSDEEYYDEVTQRCTPNVIAYPACLVV